MSDIHFQRPALRSEGLSDKITDPIPKLRLENSLQSDSQEWTEEQLDFLQDLLKKLKVIFTTISSK